MNISDPTCITAVLHSNDSETRHVSTEASLDGLRRVEGQVTVTAARNVVTHATHSSIQWMHAGYLATPLQIVSDPSSFSSIPSWSNPPSRLSLLWCRARQTDLEQLLPYEILQTLRNDQSFGGLKDILLGKNEVFLWRIKTLLIRGFDISSICFLIFIDWCFGSLAFRFRRGWWWWAVVPIGQHVINSLWIGCSNHSCGLWEYRRRRFAANSCYDALYCSVAWTIEWSDIFGRI